MKLLITGGCGFIGSHLIKYLYTKYPDYNIWNLDALTYAGNLDNLKDIEKRENLFSIDKKRYHFVHGNICDQSLVENLFSTHHFDAILNLAAESHVDRSIMGAGDFITTNIQGVHVLLDAARKYKIPRFIQMSTDEVYGDRNDIEEPTTEEEALRPSSPYSSSKAAADLLVLSYVRTFNFPAIIVRPSNNYGTHQYPEKLIPMTITNILQGIKVPVHGDGQQIRSWLYVEDCCNAIDILLHRGQENEIYNISGYPLKNIEIIEKIAGILNKDYKSVITHIPDRPGQDKKYLVNSVKLETDFKWKNKYIFDEAIKNVVKWYLDNPDWWGKLKDSKAFQNHYMKQANGQWF